MSAIGAIAVTTPERHGFSGSQYDSSFAPRGFSSASSGTSFVLRDVPLRDVPSVRCGPSSVPREPSFAREDSSLARRGVRSSGFSMIEVLVVMVVIGILAAIAIPMYLGQRDRAKDAAARAGGRLIATALLSAVLDSTADDPWPSQCDPTSLSAYLSADQWPRNPFDDSTTMHTVTERSAGNYLYQRETTGPEPRPYHLTVFLRKQADFVVP